jgi:hypothetical protein
LSERFKAIIAKTYGNPIAIRILSGAAASSQGHMPPLQGPSTLLLQPYSESKELSRESCAASGLIGIPNAADKIK